MINIVKSSLYINKPPDNIFFLCLTSKYGQVNIIDVIGSGSITKSVMWSSGGQGVLQRSRPRYDCHIGIISGFTKKKFKALVVIKA